MNAFYYRSESVELVGDETSEPSCVPSKTFRNFASLLAQPRAMLPPSSSTRALAPLAAAPRLQHQVDLTYDQARNAFVLQSSPDERFEVIPVLCRIRGTQSESAGPSAHPRAPPRSDVRVTTSSAPPRSLPRQFPATADDKSQRCRQLEKTVRDQEKIISLLENELERKQLVDGPLRVAKASRQLPWGVPVTRRRSGMTRHGTVASRAPPPAPPTPSTPPTPRLGGPPQRLRASLCPCWRAESAVSCATFVRTPRPPYDDKCDLLLETTTTIVVISVLFF
uniref:Uncharacterized protein n=1 Tax=Mesocestoides corti TaxID=53468 RepID=A0A5K3ESA1_MESCO